MAAAAASVPDALPEQEDSKMIERNEQENGGRGDLNFELFNTAEGEEDPSRLIDPALVTEIPVANAQENGQVAQAA